MAVDHVERSSRPPSLFWPLVLITLGAIILLQNFGYLPWAFWGTIWRFWPVLLIIVGVQLFLGRRHPWVATGLMVALLAATVVGAIWLAQARLYTPIIGNPFGGPQQQLALREQVISEELGDLERARVDLKLSAGNIEMGSLPADSGQLAEVRISRSAGQPDVQPSMSRRNSEGVLRIETDEDFIPGRDDGSLWSLKLSPEVPIDLDMSVGAGEYDLALSDLQVPKMSVNTGAGRILLRLPAGGGNSQVRVEAGVGDIDVVVPEGVAARIQLESGLGSVQIDESRFPRSGDGYASPDFEKAENRVDLRIHAGIGSVKVH